MRLDVCNTRMVATNNAICTREGDAGAYSGLSFSVPRCWWGSLKTMSILYMPSESLPRRMCKAGEPSDGC